MLSQVLPVEEPSSGYIRLDLTAPSSRCRKTQKKITLAGVEWIFSAALPDRKGEPDMTFTLSINKSIDSTLWGYTVDAKFHIINHKFPEWSYNKHVNQKFCFQNQYIIFSLNRRLAELCNPANGFTEERPPRGTGIFIEAAIRVTACEGVWRPVHENFYEPRGQIRSEILNVRGTRLYVSKQMMAMHSRIFEACLYPEGETEEEAAVPKEVPVPVDMELLLNFLHLIHSPAKEINFEFSAFHDLMLCCQLFKCEHLVHRLSNELINTKEMKLYRKIQLAEKFQLVRLQEVCIQSLKDSGMKTSKYHLDMLINEKNPTFKLSDMTMRRLRKIKKMSKYAII